jgi:hypothetical protein
MSRTYDNESKPSQFTTTAKPTASFLQTRGFATLQTDLDEDAPRRTGYTENFLEKIINQHSHESSDTPIQAKPMNRLKAIRSERMAIQAKLNIGEQNDKYEQEADATAYKVVKQINLPIQNQSIQKQEDEELQMKPISSIQRESAMEDGEELQMKPLVQKRENLGGGEASTDLESSIQSARGSGQSLDASLQTKMGQVMGADFSGVKVHTDSQSDQLNQSIQAKAFTTGQDVFFRQGAYDPSSQGGQELIAHELTHVVQQGGANNIQAKTAISTIQRVSVKDRINFFESLGGKGSGKVESKKEIAKLINDDEIKKELIDAGVYTQLVELVNDNPQEDDFSISESEEAEIKEKLADVGAYTAIADFDNEDDSGLISSSVVSGADKEKLAAVGAYTAVADFSNKDDNDLISSSVVSGADNKPVVISSDNDEEIAPDSNYDDPKKYKYTKVNPRQKRYAGENENSRRITHVDAEINNAKGDVKGGKFSSVDEALKTNLGWSDEDVNKYCHRWEKSRVKYLNKETRKDYELIGGSTVMQGEPPTPFDTSKMFSGYSGNGFGIYVMSPNGELYSHAHKVGLFHHSSFLAGLPTAGAGEIKVIGGVVEHITNKSGHYRPDDTNMIQTLKELQSRGVNLSGVKLTLVRTPSNPNERHYDSAQKFLDESY